MVLINQQLQPSPTSECGNAVNSDETVHARGILAPDTQDFSLAAADSAKVTNTQLVGNKASYGRTQITNSFMSFHIAV